MEGYCAAHEGHVAAPGTTELLAGGNRHFSALQCLELECKESQEGPDMAELQRIPHISLYFATPTNLRLTAGSWQSIHVYGACVAFSDIDTFVRDTEVFLHVCSKEPQGSAGMGRAIQEACRRHDLECFQWTFAVPNVSGHHAAGMVSISNDVQTAQTGGK